MLSNHASAAKLIRAKLKEHGIKAKVRASSASMTSSVDITILQDLSPAALEEVKSFCNRFQSGHFDGMTDSYEYSNSRDDIPQVKFVFISVEYSDEIKAKAKAYIADINGIDEYDRDRYEWMALNGSWGDFWADNKPRVLMAS
jgi:hypothetical protein